MNDTEYLEKMVELSKELERSAQARPYDPDAYNAIIDQLNELKHPLEQRRRRRDWWMILLLWICLGFFVGLIIRIFFLT